MSLMLDHNVLNDPMRVHPMFVSNAVAKQLIEFWSLKTKGFQIERCTALFLGQCFKSTDKLAAYTLAA